MHLKPIPRLLNANAGGGGGFFANIRSNLPFGMSNQGNPVVQPNNNPNFPSKNQLDPKNSTLDPNAQNNNNGNNEPNNDPNNNADPNKGNQGSQLDNFKDIFKLQVDDKGNPIVQQDPMSGPLLQVNPEALRAAASKLNFASGLSSELLQKAMSGSDPESFMQVLNQVAQNAFLQSTQVNAGVVETAFTKHSARIDKALPERFRDFQVRNVAPKHPALSHPAASPMVEAMKQRIASANPGLSPEKVAEHAENYFLSFANDMVTGTEQQAGKGKGQSSDPDWSALLGIN